MGLIFSLLGPRWSSSSDVCAATLHDDAYEAEERIGSEDVTGTFAKDSATDTEVDSVGGVGLTGPPPQDVSSDSDSDTDVDSDEEDQGEFGGDIWVHDKFLAQLRKPKDINIICYCHSQPGNVFWSAEAPEWPDAIVGYGFSIEEASADLQSMLEDDKLTAIEAKRVRDIKSMPSRPRTMSARKIRMGYEDGYYCEWRKSHYDKIEKESSVVVWGKIRV